MTDKQHATKLPVEDVLLFIAQQLTDTAYERFSQSEVTQTQLKNFYEIPKDWSAVSEPSATYPAFPTMIFIFRKGTPSCESSTGPLFQYAFDRQ